MDEPLVELETDKVTVEVPAPASGVLKDILAENGATSGPFAEADLAGLAAAGRLSRASMVWTPGQDGWKMAAETDLVRLLDSLPPPPPKP